MSKRIKVVCNFIIFLSLVIIFLGIDSKGYFTNLSLGSYKSDEKYTEEEILLVDFINEKLSNDEGGIYTNYIEGENLGDITQGHNILSESEGLMLQYYLYSDDKEGFHRTFKYIDDNMMIKDKLVSWRIDNNEKSEVSSTIDDMRIVRGLLIGSEQFEKNIYKYKAIGISNGIYNNLVIDNSIIDFRDKYGASETSTLCYLDLFTLKLLCQLDEKWENVYNKSIKVIDGGFISDELPLYRKNYNTTSGTYDNDQEIDTLLSCLVILNKAEVREDISQSTKWIKNQLKEKGYISSSYNLKTGKESMIESTAIYAIISQIGKEVRDKELYELSLKKMKVFQVKNKESEIYGSFGDEKNNMVYSYDNLNALLAFRRR